MFLAALSGVKPVAIAQHGRTALWPEKSILLPLKKIIQQYAFQKANWPKSAFIFENYLKEQLVGARLVWVAYVDNQFAGYVTLKWQSEYKPFASDHIPEIMDLNLHQI